VTVFHEGDPVVLGASIVLYHGSGVTLTDGNRGSHQVTINAGTEVCSTYVHADPFGFNTTFNFTIELGRTVLGVTFETGSIQEITQFDLPAVDYGGYDGLEGTDWIAVSGGSVTGSFEVQSSSEIRSESFTSATSRAPNSRRSSVAPL